VVTPLEKVWSIAHQRRLSSRWIPGGHRGAFSLIELLITLALIIVMAVMLHGFGSKSNQQRQKKACQKNLQKVYVALEIFANEHEGRFPARAGAATSEEALAVLVPRYTVSSETFICPGSKDSSLPTGESFANRKISYSYFMGRRLTDTNEVLMSDRQIDTLPKHKGASIFSSTGDSPGNNHHKYGGNLLFTDGHLEMSSARAPFPLAWTEEVKLLNPKP
jgi:type II secretory pathway pseudopilin PulG